MIAIKQLMCLQNLRIRDGPFSQFPFHFAAAVWRSALADKFRGYFTKGEGLEFPQDPCWELLYKVELLPKIGVQATLLGVQYLLVGMLFNQLLLKDLQSLTQCFSFRGDRWYDTLHRV